MRGRISLWLVGLSFLLLLGVFLPSFYRFVLTRVLILGVFAMGYDLVKGYGGLVSLGHAALFGIGGYGLALSITDSGVAGWVTVLIGIAAGLLLGATMALLTMRSTGIYFLLLTLVIGEAIFTLANASVSVTGGETGISRFNRDAVWTGLASDRAFLVACAICAIVVYLVLRVMVGSPWGLGLRGLRDSPARLEALGWSPGAMRIQVFAISGAVSAMAGIMTALHVGFIGPGSLSLVNSANVAVIAVLGGPGTLVGPAVAAGLFVVANEVISSYTTHWLLVEGAAYIVVMLVAPNGVVWAVRRRLRDRTERRAAQRTKVTALQGVGR